MRVRRMKNLEPRRARVAEYLVELPEQGALDFGQIFKTEGRPLHMEFGCGKGGFLCELSQREANVNFVGVERVPEVLVMAMEKAQAHQLENVRYMCCDVQQLERAVAPGSVSRIYLNFSDPWPKARHAKRRLTSASFLEIYGRLLEPGGQLHFKTDNRALFEFSIEQLQRYGAALSEISFDLHASPCPDNVMTEYERRFVELGQPIHRLVATFGGAARAAAAGN